MEGDAVRMDYSAPSVKISSPPRRPFGWLKRLVIGLAVTSVVLAVLTTLARFCLLITHRGRTAEVIARLDRIDPGWRSEQMEAARKVVPEGVNSATPLLSAGRMIPEDWPRTLATRPLYVPDREDDEPIRLLISTIEQTYPPPPDEEQIVALRAELVALAPALSEARKVIDKPEGRHVVALAIDPFNTQLPHLSNARQVARLLNLDSILRVHDGDADGALGSCRGVMNAGRSLGDEPFSISLTVRVAIETLAIRSIEYVLGHSEPSEGALAALQILLEDEETQPLLRVALRGERAALNDFYARLASREIKNMGDGEIPLPLHWLYAEAMHTYARGVTLEEMGRAIEIADATLSRQRDLAEAWGQGLSARASAGIWDKVARLLLPAVSQLVDSYVNSRSRLRAAIVAVAAERYRHKHGHWPESTEQLTPWPLEGIPTDPHSEALLTWLRSDADGSLVIYSVGPNLVDDEGSLEQDPKFAPAPKGKPRVDKPYWDEKAIGFRLLDVASRREVALPKDESSHPSKTPR